MVIKGTAIVKSIALKLNSVGSVEGVVSLIIDRKTANELAQVMEQQVDVTLSTRQLSFGEIKVKVGKAKKQIKEGE